MKVQAVFAKLEGNDLETAKATWLKPDLATKLSEGFPLKVRAFSTMEEYVRIIHKFVVGFMREDHQSKIMKTTVDFRAEVARSMYYTMVHKDWSRVLKAISEEWWQDKCM